MGDQSICLLSWEEAKWSRGTWASAGADPYERPQKTFERWGNEPVKRAWATKKSGRNMGQAGYNGVMVVRASQSSRRAYLSGVNQEGGVVRRSNLNSQSASKALYCENPSHEEKRSKRNTVQWA